jgi:hypothetical protein
MHRFKLLLVDPGDRPPILPLSEAPSRVCVMTAALHGIAEVPAAGPVCELSKQMLIGRGTKRECYTHPEDPGLCLKVPRYAWQSACHEQNVIEWRYFQWLQKKQVPLKHAARCAGWMHTDRGLALISERVRDQSGVNGVTLRDALLAGDVDLSQAHVMLDTLKQWALRYSVVIADLRSANLLVQHAEDVHSYL